MFLKMKERWQNSNRNNQLIVTILDNLGMPSHAYYFILQIYKYTIKSIFDKWKGTTNIDERGTIEFSLFYKNHHLFHVICYF